MIGAGFKCNRCGALAVLCGPLRLALPAGWVQVDLPSGMFFTPTAARHFCPECSAPLKAAMEPVESTF